MTIEALQERLDRTRRDAHAHCIACGTTNGHAPRLRFMSTSDGGVQTTFQPDPSLEGYDGMLHGGIIATLLDAAMTNCLFAQGHCGVTADLRLRYRHPVTSCEACTLRAWIERAQRTLFTMRAELRQADQVRVTATAKFMVKKPLPS